MATTKPTSEKEQTKEQKTNGLNKSLLKTKSNAQDIYDTTHKVRVVTAASLFDGHDASINIMRRVLQSSGAEVIHLGHNCSARQIVEAAIMEDAQSIAVSSYQGGHVEFFKYMVDLLQDFGASHIKVFGGGGGTIIKQEIEELHEYGVSKIFSVEDGRNMGLQGMINHILEVCDFDNGDYLPLNTDKITNDNHLMIARGISELERGTGMIKWEKDTLVGPDNSTLKVEKEVPLIGITGTGGAGKSSLTDELILRFVNEFPDKSIGILSVDPSRVKTGGALLGDRIRMNSLGRGNIYMRSMATRESNRALSDAVEGAVEMLKAAGFDLVIVETSGIGQGDSEIVELVDLTLYVMTSEYGAATQLEKINMLDLADFVVLNKFEKQGSEDALRDVRKQYKRNMGLWDAGDKELPIYPTIASRFNDEGVHRLFKAIIDVIDANFAMEWEVKNFEKNVPANDLSYEAIIPEQRNRYLSEIAGSVRDYHKWVEDQSDIARKLQQIEGALDQLEQIDEGDAETPVGRLEKLKEKWRQKLDEDVAGILEEWSDLYERYRQDTLDIKIRDKTITQNLYRESLSGLRIPRVAFPKTRDYGEKVKFALKENVPGRFPYTGGVFPLKREGEEPTRMFAGEGTPERTNKRFHYVSHGQPAARLSTAFDSVTLYGEDPDWRPDIYGKVGNSGVSIATLDDMKKLFSGFELVKPHTSVSMTINGPAPMILAMFLNTAIDQEVERYIKEQGDWEDAKSEIENYFAERNSKTPQYNRDLPEGNEGFGLGTLGITGDWLVDSETYQNIKAEALKQVRGTVQADILKEDQAQNTCIFSTEFALKMMGDVQEYFTRNQVRNYYSVSISGYHIAEAGANPITQAAFTLANGFTYVEHYLARGLDIDEFAHNLSFFFSNGMDAEYAVIGRVARRIWAVAMKYLYNANSRSQKLKYHIQTSGRSLHAQEVQFNDIRTTLQALMAIYDNCNSLHTNAFDEAITTPTEESVRRALAIQMIINKEMGAARNENINQGSYFIEELTDLVEEAILSEFDRLTKRGGVLGAMENMYQRSKIQDESLYYEKQKHNGDIPIIGVNTFLPDNKTSEKEEADGKLSRSSKEEKESQISSLEDFKSRHAGEKDEALKQLKYSARGGKNIFETLMETVKAASLGEITHSLYDVGGQYRRNI